MPTDPYGQMFVLGAQAGANASHYRSLARQMQALDRIYDALEAGHTPADALYRLAGLQSSGAFKPFDLEEALAKVGEKTIQQQKTEAKQAAQKAVVSGQIKDSARRAAERTRDTGTWRSIGGIRGPLSRGGFSGNPLIPILMESAAQAGRETARNRRLDRERRQRLSLGRRGALASRGFVPTGRTNRTGAKSVRPYVSSPTAPASGTRAGTGDASNSGTQSRQQPANVPGVSGSRSNQTPTVRPIPRNTGAVVSQPRTPSWAEKQLSQYLSQQLTSGSRTRSASRLTTGMRAASRPSASRSTMSSPYSSSGTAPSPTTAQLLGLDTAQASKECKCPKPKREEKKKKDRSNSCRNPQISKTIADGIITIKRKLQCPPSKPK